MAAARWGLGEEAKDREHRLPLGHHSSSRRRPSHRWEITGGSAKHGPRLDSRDGDMGAAPPVGGSRRLGGEPVSWFHDFMVWNRLGGRGRGIWR